MLPPLFVIVLAVILLSRLYLPLFQLILFETKFASVSFQGPVFVHNFTYKEIRLEMTQRRSFRTNTLSRVLIMILFNFVGLKRVSSLFSFGVSSVYRGIVFWYLVGKNEGGKYINEHVAIISQDARKWI